MYVHGVLPTKNLAQHYCKEKNLMKKGYSELYLYLTVASITVVVYRIITILVCEP